MVLPRNGDITLEALRKIYDMVKKGAVVYGNRPVMSNSGEDLGKSKEYNRLVSELWGKKKSASGNISIGKGKIYWGMSLEKALMMADIKPDIRLKNGDTKTSMIYFTHRKVKDADIYFIDNHKDIADNNIFTFASTGKYVQLWNSVTGERFSPSVIKSDDESVTIGLDIIAR